MSEEEKEFKDTDINVPDDDEVKFVELSDDGDTITTSDDGDELPDEEEVRLQLKQTEGRAEEAEARLAASEARAMELENERLEKNNTDYTNSEKEILERKKEARNSGDMDAYDDALMELRELDRKPRAVPRRKPDTSSAPTLAPAAESWLEKNKWFSDPQYAKQHDIAVRIERDLIAAKLPMDEAFYRELDKRYLASQTSKKSSRVAPPTRADVPPEINRSKSQGGGLTNSDIKTMRAYNLDPNDVSHRKAFLKRRG